MIFKDYQITAFIINQKYRLKAQINLSNFLFRDLILTFLSFLKSTPRALTIGDDNMTDFSRRQFLTSISATSQQLIPTIEVPEDVEMITKGLTLTGPDYKKSTSLFNMDETII